MGQLQSIEELATRIDQLGKLGKVLKQKTAGISGHSDDPKMVGAILFMRGWGHFCAFSELWRNKHVVEAEIILRCSVEVALCMANVMRRPTEFIVELKADSHHTLRGQVNMMRDGKYDFVDELSSEVVEMFGEGKGSGLNWRELANNVQAANLYRFHKNLSGTVAHVTGVSLLRNLDGDDAEFEGLLQNRTLAWMYATMLTTCRDYANLIGSGDVFTEIGKMIAEDIEKYGDRSDFETLA